MHNKSEILSLQHSYTAVVHLVRHKYGPTLYHDLRSSMKRAAEMVLPECDVRAASDREDGHAVIRYVNGQYQIYLEYLLLCKHVFLPLDNSQLSWTPQAVAAAVAAAAAGAHPGGDGNAAAATAQPHQQAYLTVWQVGLEQFGARLADLGTDRTLYMEWMNALLSDWNGGASSWSSSSAFSLAATSTVATTSADLQAVWYLWQDLGWLPTLPLQQDLEDHWKKISFQWKEDAAASTSASAVGASTAPAVSYYRAPEFLRFAYDKHAHVTSWPWLPSPWLWSILESCLIAPHMTSDYLLKKEHLHPILQDELLAQLQAAAGATRSTGIDTTSSPMAMADRGSAATGSAATLTPTQQLWMLAGRLPNGQQQVAGALAEFARVQGLQKVQPQQQQQQQGGSAEGSAASAGSRKPAPSSTLALASRSTQVVNDLLELQEGLNRMLATLPHSHDFVSLKSTWEEVVNVDTQPSLAESLAKFLDQLLRSNKRMDQFEAKSPDGVWLQKIIAGIFVPIQAKDVFEAFYKRDLAKRLLMNRVVSMDIEKQVCSLLKAECGAGYTAKVEGMFQDVEWSRETMNVYKQSAAAAPGIPAANPSVEMEVQVLTTGYWPVYPQYPNLHLPDSLLEPQNRFETHYKSKYQGRRMTWQYALGHCIVHTNGFAGQKYELIVGLCQALVLIQFADDTRHTLPALMKIVGLEDRSEMERTLLSLSLGKDGTRILRKLDYDRDENKKKKPRMSVDDRDEFTINSLFQSKSKRIRINNIMMKETKEEREKTVETVSRDRLYLIDAVLVRIMKARKTITHQALIPQVLEQVKVPAQASDVKKRIESLIEREYMERDAKDRNRYNYLA